MLRARLACGRVRAIVARRSMAAISRATKQGDTLALHSSDRRLCFVKMVQRRNEGDCCFGSARPTAPTANEWKQSVTAWRERCSSRMGSLLPASLSGRPVRPT